MGEVTTVEVNALIAAHAADLDAHTRDIWEVVALGRYLPSPLVAYYLMDITLTHVIDTLYAFPYPIVRARTPATLCLEVQTADVGKFARIGIYNDNGACYPGTRLTNGGIVDVGAVGLKTVVYTTPLPKGLYWIAVISDGTPKLYAAANFQTLIGRTDLLRSYPAGYSIADTYGDLPDPFPVGAANSAPFPAVGFSFSSND